MEADDDWDADDYEIPSLKAGKESGTSNLDKPPKVNDAEQHKAAEETADRSASEAVQPVNAPGRKQKLKHKLKELGEEKNDTGRENKMAVLQDLMGVKAKIAVNEKPKEWLDPHCNEADFDHPRQK